jgi:two-component system chemotaxis response regulator CheY
MTSPSMIETSAAPAPGPAPGPVATRHGKRVLVVDDAVTIRMFCRQILEAGGFHVDEAVNGLEALEKILVEPVDLLVVDVNMTRMDGYTLLRRVRQDPGLCAIPALMLSTEDKEADHRRAFEAGANHYMTKPVKPEAFLAVVRLMAGVVPP